MDPVGGSETVVASHIEESVLVSVVARRPVSPTQRCAVSLTARARSRFLPDLESRAGFNSRPGKLLPLTAAQVLRKLAFDGHTCVRLTATA